MSSERNVAEIPATERAVVGLCHDLNDQLAAVSAYAFLLKRRGALGDMEEQLQEHLDRLAHCVRLVRSLCRNPDAEVGPMALSLVAESLTDTLRAHPDGPIRFEIPVGNGDAADVVHYDWARALRAVVEVASWARRGIDPTETATVTLSLGEEANTVRVALLGEAPEASADQPVDVGDPDVAVAVLGPREAVVSFPPPVRDTARD